MDEYKLLWDHFERLRDETDPQRRGRGLEVLVGEIFRRNHFSVVKNAGAARPRQTDFYATLGSERYLVEVKWTLRPTDIATIASVRDRLRRTAPGVMGLVVSVSGFTSSAISDTGTYRDGAPLLLIDGDELEELLWYWSRLRSLLKTKVQDLLAHGIVRTTFLQRRIWVSERPVGLPPPTLINYDYSNTRGPVTYGTSRGPHCVFVTSLPSQEGELVSYGVDLELELAPQTPAELVRTLRTLQQMGWTGGEGRWSILDATAEVTTTGFGIETFMAEVARFRRRGSEAVSYAYFDNAERDGFYTLTGTLATDPRNNPQWDSHLTFYLAGIPLDTEPYRDLAHAVDVLAPPAFEPRAAPRVLQRACEESERPALILLAGLVEDRAGLGAACTSAVFRNPYFDGLDTPTEVPAAAWSSLASTEVLIAGLYIPFDPQRPPNTFHLMGADVAKVAGLELWRLFVWADEEEDLN